jgi:hypothetical protein
VSGFCGNPNNHEEHFECEGVNRPGIKEEVIIEKWEPELNKPAYPAPENMKDRSEGWMKGWYAGHDGHNALTAEASEEFCDGFNEALQWRLVRGLIKVNAARALQGLPELPEYDPVKIPEHYNTGKIEVTNFIADQGLNFPRGNVVKYVCRAGKKDPDKELQDLEKAAAYLQMSYNLAQGKPAVVRDPVTNEVVWSLFQN